MEYIDPTVGITSQEDTLKACGGVNISLDKYSKETSLYVYSLLTDITQDELYILTQDGKAYPGDSIVCKETKTKDLIDRDTVKVVYNEGSRTLQFMAFFKDGTAIDARGYYAQNKLKIFKRKRKGTQK